MKPLLIAISLGLMVAWPAQAQNAAPSGQTGGQSEAVKCADKPAASASEPGQSETPPAAGPNSGTAPGGSGSTGWTGGTGGSNIGTTPSKPVETSPQEHPAVATGLDPIAGGTTAPEAPAKSASSDC